MRCQQKIAFITLVFFSFYPALARSQSQKSQIWRVPVVSPEMVSENPEIDSPSALTPAPDRVSFFDSLIMKDSENRRSAHSASISSDQFSLGVGIRQALQDVGVFALGSETSFGENGKLSMRASPGQEPLVHVDGVPLSSGFSGLSPESLIPKIAIRHIEVFPFISQTGLPRRGNSGSLDFRLRVAEIKRQNELHLSAADSREALLAQFYSPPCQNDGFFGCISGSWQLGTRSGAQRVKDDNNTPLIDSDDTLQPLRYNSSSKWGGHFKLHKASTTGVMYETSALFGVHERGLNGLPVSSASPLNRAKGSFQLLSHSGFLFSPITGNTWSYGLSGRTDKASFSSKLNTAAGGQRNDDRSEQMLLGRFGFSHPLEGQLRPRVFTSGSYERNAFESHLNFTTPQSSVNLLAQSATVSKGTLENLDFGGGLEFFPFNETLVRTELFFQWAQMSQQFVCGAFSPRVLCEAQLSSISRSSPGGAFELQKKLTKSLILYGLLGRTVRLPRPVELMGRPDGIVPNRALLPESSDFLELGLQTPYLHSGVYHGRDRNLITLEQVSPYLAQFDNRPQVHRLGFFSSGEARFGNTGAQFSYERAWVTGNGRTGKQMPVPFVPASQASGQLSYSGSTPLLGLKAPRTVLSVSRSGEYFLDRDATYQLFPPAQIGLMFGGQLRMSETALNIELSIKNLMNKRVSVLRRLGGGQSEVGWSYLPALPLVGRSVVLSLSLKSS